MLALAGVAIVVAGVGMLVLSCLLQLQVMQPQPIAHVCTHSLVIRYEGYKDDIAFDKGLPSSAALDNIGDIVKECQLFHNVGTYADMKRFCEHIRAMDEVDSQWSSLGLVARFLADMLHDWNMIDREDQSPEEIDLQDMAADYIGDVENKGLSSKAALKLLRQKATNNVELAVFCTGQALADSVPHGCSIHKTVEFAPC